MSHCTNDMPPFNNWNCSFGITELPGIVDGKGESEVDFQKRILYNKSPSDLRHILSEHIKEENYEFCVLIRDVANERGINLL